MIGQILGWAGLAGLGLAVAMPAFELAFLAGAGACFISAGLIAIALKGV